MVGAERKEKVGQEDVIVDRGLKTWSQAPGGFRVPSMGVFSRGTGRGDKASNPQSLHVFEQPKQSDVHKDDRDDGEDYPESH